MFRLAWVLTGRFASFWWSKSRLHFRSSIGEVTLYVPGIVFCWFAPDMPPCCQNLHRQICAVVEGFLDRPGRGLKCTHLYFAMRRFTDDLYVVLDLVLPPDLTQARVNKCLVALVNRKIVTKENSTVGDLFTFPF